MPWNRVYVGLKKISWNQFSLEKFWFRGKPDEKSGLPYLAVIGPFRTTVGADIMVRAGVNPNPFFYTVSYCEQWAKKIREREG